MSLPLWPRDLWEQFRLSDSNDVTVLVVIFLADLVYGGPFPFLGRTAASSSSKDAGNGNPATSVMSWGTATKLRFGRKNAADTSAP